VLHSSIIRSDSIIKWGSEDNKAAHSKWEMDDDDSDDDDCDDNGFHNNAECRN
jgi:hypothetical protein